MWTKCGCVKPISESHATLQKQRYRNSDPAKVRVNPGVGRERLVQNSLCAVPWGAMILACLLWPDIHASPLQ